MKTQQSKLRFNEMKLECWFKAFILIYKYIFIQKIQNYMHVCNWSLQVVSFEIPKGPKVAIYSKKSYFSEKIIPFLDPKGL